jgi:ribokinase
MKESKFFSPPNSKMKHTNTVSNILVFGSLNIDDVYSVPDIVVSGETISSHDYKQVAGGKGANQSIATSKCTRSNSNTKNNNHDVSSVRVYHAGKVGKDGLWLVDLLESEGVITKDLITTSDKVPTGPTLPIQSTHY